MDQIERAFKNIPKMMTLAQPFSASSITPSFNYGYGGVHPLMNPHYYQPHPNTWGVYRTENDRNFDNITSLPIQNELKSPGDAKSSSRSDKKEVGINHIEKLEKEKKKFQEISLKQPLVESNLFDSKLRDSQSSIASKKSDPKQNERAKASINSSMKNSQSNNLKKKASSQN